MIINPKYIEATQIQVLTIEKFTEICLNDEVKIAGFNKNDLVLVISTEQGEYGLYKPFKKELGIDNLLEICGLRKVKQ